MKEDVLESVYFLGVFISTKDLDNWILWWSIKKYLGKLDTSTLDNPLYLVHPISYIHSLKEDDVFSSWTLSRVQDLYLSLWSFWWSFIGGSEVKTSSGILPCEYWPHRTKPIPVPSPMSTETLLISEHDSPPLITQCTEKMISMKCCHSSTSSMISTHFPLYTVGTMVQEKVCLARSLPYPESPSNHIFNLIHLVSFTTSWKPCESENAIIPWLYPVNNIYHSLVYLFERLYNMERKFFFCVLRYTGSEVSVISVYFCDFFLFEHPVENNESYIHK